MLWITSLACLSWCDSLLPFDVSRIATFLIERCSTTSYIRISIQGSTIEMFHSIFFPLKVAQTEPHWWWKRWKWDGLQWFDEERKITRRRAKCWPSAGGPVWNPSIWWWDLHTFAEKRTRLNVRVRYTSSCRRASYLYVHCRAICLFYPGRASR